MSNRELCMSMLDSFTESQLGNVAAMLQTMKRAIEEAMAEPDSDGGEYYGEIVYNDYDAAREL